MCWNKITFEYQHSSQNDYNKNSDKCYCAWNFSVAPHFAQSLYKATSPMQFCSSVISDCFIYSFPHILCPPMLASLLFLECGKHIFISRLLHQLFAPPRIIAPQIFTSVCPHVTFSVRSILTSLFHTVICPLSPRHFWPLLSCSTFLFDVGFYFHV